jgi:signal transduction histidine kinase
VKCSDQSTHWEVSVQDNGIGFETRHADRIFQMFQRVHDRDSGSGIGLTIARRIIGRHGGRIWANAVVGEGAVFQFTLPKHPALEAPREVHAQAI